MRKKKDYDDDEYYEEKQGHGFIILLCILCFIIVGGGTFAGFYFYHSNNSNKSSNVERAYVSVGDITAKLSDDNSKRYVKAEISVGYDKTMFNKAEKELTKEKQLPVVTDALSFDLMQKKSDYFTGDYENKLKEDLIDAVNKKVQNFKITDIKITNLIVQ